MKINEKAIYFPGLNGLRAIAAIAVVISHTTIALSTFNVPHNIFVSDHTMSKGLSLAAYGVTIFFVLSGFLITYLLQVEKETQPIAIKKFYLRRILRIWPLYYIYLVLCVTTILVFGLDLNISSLFFYIFYAANVPFILGTTLPFLAHYWSLGVEEQFYLFWPWLIKKIKYLELTIFSLIVILIGTKLILHFSSSDSLIELAVRVTNFHCMMIGGLGAILYMKKHKLFMKLTNNKLSQAFCWIVMFFLAINKFHLISAIDGELIAIVALILMIGQIEIKNRIVNLDNGLFNFLGKISYGIYVIHPLLIYLLSKILYPVNIGSNYKCVLIYITITGTTILLAYLSYTYIEKYFLKFKSRYTVVKSSATKL